MTKDQATEVNKLALQAIENLSSILMLGNEYPEYAAMKKAVGLCIGKIQMDMLEPIYKSYPDLNNRK